MNFPFAHRRSIRHIVGFVTLAGALAGHCGITHAATPPAGYLSADRQDVIHSAPPIPLANVAPKMPVPALATLVSKSSANMLADSAIDCNQPGQTPIAAEAVLLSGTALTDYFANHPYLCSIRAQTLYDINATNYQLYSTQNLLSITTSLTTRLDAYSNTHQAAGMGELLHVIYAAYYVEFFAQDKFHISPSTKAAVHDVLVALGASTVLQDSTEAGAGTIREYFQVLDIVNDYPTLFTKGGGYLNLHIAGGDAYKTYMHHLALNSLYFGLFRATSNADAAFTNFLAPQPATVLDPYKNAAIYFAYALTANGGEFRNTADAAVTEYMRFISYPSKTSYVSSSIVNVLAAYPRLSSPWMTVPKTIDYYGGANCANYNICRSTLVPEITSVVFPNSFSFDDGKLQFFTAVSEPKVQQLYYALKQVDAQFYRKTQHIDPIASDPNPVLKARIYGSKQAYLDFHTYLYALDTNNGGIYIEKDGTFYTYERTSAESIYSLEELFRHEYVHYLMSRFSEPGMWGDVPLYANERLTWFDEGVAEFFAGATQFNDVRYRKNKIQNIASDPAPRMTVAEIVAAKYGNFRFYDYAALLINYLDEMRPATFGDLFSKLKAGDTNGFDAIVAELKNDPQVQTEYTAYVDQRIAGLQALPAFSEGAAYSSADFQMGDAATIESGIRAQLLDATCAKVFEKRNPRVGCTGTVTTPWNQKLNASIQALVATGINNWKTLNCRYRKIDTNQASYYCEVGIRGVSLLGVRSRKTHGTAGPFDLTINPNPGPSGPVTIEPRIAQGGHAIVFQFNEVVTIAGNASVVDAQGNAVGSASVQAAGFDVIATLNGIADGARVTVNLTGVNGASNVTVTVKFLLGDSNGDGLIKAGDVLAVKSRSGSVTNAGNFRYDLNASGVINAVDIALVKARPGYAQ